ncbi:amidohydrolase family protein [Saccharopolyspora sp. MS10]|uniref:amidohydrolase family protein n=1 Tax=Saccharopolyspora sp. MS10 TaxID=3385973 RepID=UPI00399FFFA9
MCNHDGTNKFETCESAVDGGWGLAEGLVLRRQDEYAQVRRPPSHGHACGECSADADPGLAREGAGPNAGFERGRRGSTSIVSRPHEPETEPVKRRGTRQLPAPLPHPHPGREHTHPLRTTIDSEVADALLDNDHDFIRNHSTPAAAFARRLRAHPTPAGAEPADARELCTTQLGYTAERALDLATTRTANLLGITHRTGALSPGVAADLLIVEVAPPTASAPQAPAPRPRGRTTTSRTPGRPHGADRQLTFYRAKAGRLVSEHQPLTAFDRSSRSIQR